MDRAFFYYGCIYLFMCLWFGAQPVWAVQHVHRAEQHTHDGFEHQHSAAHPPSIQNLAEHALDHWAKRGEIDSKYHPSKPNKPKSPSFGLFQVFAVNFSEPKPLLLASSALYFKPRLPPYLTPEPRASPI